MHSYGMTPQLPPLPNWYAGQHITKPDPIPQLVEPGDPLKLWVVTKDTVSCPSCTVPLIKPDFDNRRCLACHQYLILMGEDIFELIAHRAAYNFYAYELEKAAESGYYVYVTTP